jgi:hypothetical protein
MIKVTVELHKGGQGGEVVPLGVVIIGNDGTGTETRGNYVTRQLSKMGHTVRAGSVVNHARKAESIWRLVRKAIESLGHGDEK